MCVCVCVCVCAQTAWSAVLSYRKSRGRPPLVICAGEVEHDSSFPPLHPLFKFSLLPFSLLVSPYSFHVICSPPTFIFLMSLQLFLYFFFSDCTSLHSFPTSTLSFSPSSSLHSHLSYFLFLSTPAHLCATFHSLPLRKILWRGVMVPNLCQYGTAWPNSWWTTFKLKLQFACAESKKDTSEQILQTKPLWPDYYQSNPNQTSSR